MEPMEPVALHAPDQHGLQTEQSECPPERRSERMTRLMPTIGIAPNEEPWVRVAAVFRFPREAIRPLASVLIALLVGMFTAGARGTAALGEQQSNARFDKEVAIHYVDAGGLRLRYATAGQGDPLLLLHTMRTQLEYFRAILPTLARAHQVIALDLPGHGESAIPDVEYTESFFTKSVAAVLNQLDLRNVTLVGESVGGAIALSLVADNPEGRVRRVVAINPYNYSDPDAGGITRSSTFAKMVFTAVEWPAMGWLMSLSERPFVLRRILQGGFHDPTHLPDDLVTLFANTGARQGFHCAERSLFRHWQSWVDARRKYEAIRVPVLLVYGAQDWSLEGERLDNQKRIAGSQLVTLERTGHFASLESPDQVLRAILGQSCRVCG
jgi:pimeloyl-ACP methyl ester carboxylesterase